MMKLAIDAMGGDHAPAETVKGGIEALGAISSEIVLIGDEPVIREELKKYTYDETRVHIIHAPDRITNDDKPVQAIKTKKFSSLVIGFEMLRKGEIDALISAGNTGALLAGGALKVGRIKGIDRPALTTVYPTEKGIAVLVDAGANTMCMPRNLVEFATMGSIYAQEVLGIEFPKVGLVNVGAEEGKGNTLVSETFDLLKETNLNFIGNLEARDIPLGAADVIVCDGFTGNVILKLSEGLAQSFGRFLRELFGKNAVTKIAALLLSEGLKTFKKRMDYREYGGAPLLGTLHPIVKAHGSSNARAFMNAFRYAEKYAATGVIEKIQAQLADAGGSSAVLKQVEIREQE